MVLECSKRTIRPAGWEAVIRPAVQSKLGKEYGENQTLLLEITTNSIDLLIASGSIRKTK